MADLVEQEPEARASPPLLFFYTHLHDAIRSELDTLGEAVLRLEAHAGDPAELEPRLARLRGRYLFLEQVYKYHSSVEDEVRGAPRRARLRACRGPDAAAAAPPPPRARAAAEPKP